MVRIFHTADVHVGLKFTRGYPESLQGSLVDERVAVVAKMADLANQERCQLFVIAGDLFDHLRVSKKVIRQTAEALRRFDGLVAVLPGNHDYKSEADDPIWPDFKDSLGEGHLILDRCVPYDLEPFGMPVVLLPGVCTAKHSKENAVGWIKEVTADLPESKLKIGVAHGSLAGLSPDFNGDYYPMQQTELSKMDVDVWLLGHTHIRFPDRDEGSDARVFYPSTPEPDGFDCRHAGHALVIDVGEDGTCEYRSVRTGRFRFHVMHKTGTDSELKLAQLKKEFEELSEGDHLVKLKLQGRLDNEALEQLKTLESELGELVSYLEFNADEVLRVVRQEDLDAEFTEGSFPHQLLSELAHDESDQFALQMAYDLVREAR
ncbi:metallophosphoesterase family protein [Allorhodopirellula heiligendammensis]|uniref:Metallophosphoesterase YhaO n=1 Tax=Allorhodopirellula heiligendammensis TaxID=2714739 RepID=A0A5C6BD18_9BACT|nr:DNA repair exonuclease [Allorhodopirellula heiligendammensis]TWU09948.1 putative metallophosphoesterase YhaO [Allorhodopirellula heiligendammensis]